MLSYLQSGTDGTPLVLLHAFPLNAQMWRAQMNLAPLVLAPDYPGFGGSPSRAMTMDSLADEVAALCPDEKIVLCGVSMGGYVAQAFARRHPDKLRALILCDTRAEADSDEARAKRDEMIAFAQSHSPQEVAEKMLPNLLGETTRRERPEVGDDVRRLAGENSREGIIAALRALRDRPDARKSLAKISVPTLLIRGEEDAITPLEAMQSMAETIPNARLERINGAGHLPNLEQAEAFNQVVSRFLAAIEKETR